MNTFTFKPFSVIFSQINFYSKALFVRLGTNILSAFLLFLMLSSSTIGTAQTHTFASFDAGTLTSGTAGVSVPLPTTGVTGDYLIYEISADFVGTGNVAWSSTIEMELNNGGGLIFKDVDKATSGSLDSGNATTLLWTGVLKKSYVGGDDLTIRFFDSFHDGSGPYTSSITNVVISISKAETHAFPSFDAGILTSGTPGVSVPLTTTGVTGDYLIYQISADFVGTGNVAWSSTIEIEINNGGSEIFKDLAKATSGSLDSGNATTMYWTGVLNKKYVGGNDLTIRFSDSFHDASGPYTSNITNVVVSIAKANPHDFSSFDAGTLTSGTPGVSIPLTTTGVTGDYLIYQISADFVGTGNVAWSSTMEMELNNGGSLIFKPLDKANIGSLDSGNATTLHWTGVLNKTYTGGDNLTIRFADSFHDASGPYTSSITNVNLAIANFNSSTLNVERLDSNTNFLVSPVPFNNEVFVDYSFDYQTDVTIELYDLKGALLKSIVNKNYASGSQSKTKLDLRALSNQMFFVKLITNKGISVKKIISN
jgi:hypothetical protein